MTKVILTTLALIALPAHAQTFGIHVASHHTKSGYCDVNPGAYYRAATGLTVGAYRNSECSRWSAYVGHTWTRGRFAVTAGAITGYERAAVLPMIAPSVRVGYARIAFMPPLGGNTTGVIHLMLEYPMD